ncbi:preprotein translocase, YajC subunit [Actinobaculum suis]|uniref:Preprotein translocase subunit YajC n=1 Tax=Actinobaculum suis TaxID=1657 RepID=A0A1G7BJQ4_9ACTO|nr:preprotein translocase subunit YajC [Actinobaculum suis]MDY5153740.1 preprotein translocase subunit YajC [Actinobaculum suis]SDE27157.1 preprotein translocase, YajC subunit [Actinobaculum suis]
MGPEFIVLLVVMVVMMWFFSRSSKKQREKMENERDSAITIGANVMTSSGFFGTIVSIDGDAITLESPSGDESVWIRKAIMGRAEIPFAPISEAEAAELDKAEAAEAAALNGTEAAEAADEAEGTAAAEDFSQAGDTENAELAAKNTAAQSDSAAAGNTADAGNKTENRGSAFESEPQTGFPAGRTAEPKERPGNAWL